RGGGPDGADGVQGVKQHGGVVIAQDQTTAQLSFAKMSRDAADASQADGVTKRILPKRPGTPTRTAPPRRHVAGRQQSSRRSTMPVRLHVCRMMQSANFREGDHVSFGWRLNAS